MTAGTALEHIPFSVLELAWRDHGQSNSDAVRASIALARNAEELGCHRFWFAEHHGLPCSTASSPAILIAAAAAATSTMRVGAGGVMLPNYSPFSVAEQFGTLKALHGDRIDLGIGRSTGGDGVISRALRRIQSPTAAESSQEVGELLGYFHGHRGHQAAHPMAVPGLGDAPQTWLLGSSSGFSARLAGRLGLPFVHAHHFSAEDTEQVLDLYRESFEPSEFLDAPHSMISVMLVSDESRDVTHTEMLPSAITFLRMLRGQRPGPVSAEEARTYDFTAADREIIAHRNARQAIGTPDVVGSRLRSLVASTGVDELMFQLIGSTPAGRLHSLEIVKELMHSQITESVASETRP